MSMTDRPETFQRATFTIAITALLFCCRFTWAQTPPATKDDDAETRLKYMLSALGEYRVTLADDNSTEVPLVGEPALRWTNTISSTHDGIVGVYAVESGRPEVVVQFSLKGQKNWIYEFASTSLRPFEMKRRGAAVWKPDASGAERKAIPDAPPPADTANQRLLQIRQLAARFEFEDDFHPQYARPETETHTLRLLTKPLYRYGGVGDVVDGALFGLVITTDPEALLMIEAVKTSQGTEWVYALAPMTVYTLRAKLDGNEIWNRPENRSWSFNDPYFVGLHR